MLFLKIYFLLASAFANEYGFHYIEDGEMFTSEECLPKEAQIMLKSKDKTISVSNHYSLKGKEKFSETMSKSVHFSATEYPTAPKSCAVENIKIFHNKQFYDLGKDVRFRYVLFESGDDCQYGTPRLVITFPYNQIKSGFTLASGFNVLDEKKSKDAAQRFQEAFKKAVPKDEPNPGIYINVHFGYPYAYFEREKEPGTVYAITSKSEMGVTMALYQLKGNTLKYIGVAEFPACGS